MLTLLPSEHVGARNIWILSRSSAQRGEIETPARAVPTFQQFLQAAPHHMDVLYANEFKTNVLIIIFILIALPSSSVGHGIQLANSRSRKEREKSQQNSERLFCSSFFIFLCFFLFKPPTVVTQLYFATSQTVFSPVSLKLLQFISQRLIKALLRVE